MVIYKSITSQNGVKMSDSKYKYYTVTNTKIVRANSQSDAVAAANGRRGVDAKVLSTETDAWRISASEAKSFTA